MNFYKRHLGDIAKSCAHLSQGQMGAYDLLLDWHYANELPLPLDKSSLYRIGRAVTRAEKDNVDTVLVMFFEQVDAGYVQRRAVKEMDKASAQADTNRRIAEEREARRRAAKQARSVHETSNDAEHEACTKRQPSQTPDSRQEQEQFLASPPELAGAEPSPPSVGLPEPVDRPMPAATPRPAIPTAAGLACRLMRDAGCAVTNPGHPDLLAALAEGCTPEELAATAAEAIATGIGKPFAWALVTTRRRRAQGPKPVTTGAPRHDHADHRRSSSRPSLVERAAAAERRTLERLDAAERGQPGEALAADGGDLRAPLDGSARRVGGR